LRITSGTLEKREKKRRIKIQVEHMDMEVVWSTIIYRQGEKRAVVGGYERVINTVHS